MQLLVSILHVILLIFVQVLACVESPLDGGLLLILRLNLLSGGRSYRFGSLQRCLRSYIWMY